MDALVNLLQFLQARQANRGPGGSPAEHVSQSFSSHPAARAKGMARHSATCRKPIRRRAVLRAPLISLPALSRPQGRPFRVQGPGAGRPSHLQAFISTARGRPDPARRRRRRRRRR